MQPSTSRTCTSKVGITNGSPAVRQRGNIGGLLGARGISRSSLESRDYDVKNTWRCRDKALSQIRIFVEHAIGGMKRYNILVHSFRNRTEHFEDDAMGICAGLWNLLLSY